MAEWSDHAEREIVRYRDGEARLPAADESDPRQKQLTRMGNAAGGAGLALLMHGDKDQADRVVPSRCRPVPGKHGGGAAG